MAAEREGGLVSAAFGMMSDGTTRRSRWWGSRGTRRRPTVGGSRRRAGVPTVCPARRSGRRRPGAPTGVAIPGAMIGIPALCNSKERGPGRTTRVGEYPEGESPYGVEDMVGRFGSGAAVDSMGVSSYPYRADDGREDEAGDSRYPSGRFLVEQQSSRFLPLRLSLRGRSRDQAQLRGLSLRPNPLLSLLSLSFVLCFWGLGRSPSRA